MADSPFGNMQDGEWVGIWVDLMGCESPETLTAALWLLREGWRQARKRWRAEGVTTRGVTLLHKPGKSISWKTRKEERR